MQSTNIIKTIVGPLIILIVIGVGWRTRDTWKTWLLPAKQAKEEEKPAASDNPERVKISEQAQRNLNLVVKEATLTTYWRKIYLPGTVVDRPGHSDRGVPAPIAGVVTEVKCIPGKTVRAGDELFRLRLVSDSFQTSQMELYLNTRELEIVNKERKRLQAIGEPAVPATKLLDLQYQQERLKVKIEAHRQDLLLRQLTKEQIDEIEKGNLVREIVIRMPDRIGHLHDDLVETKSAAAKTVEYEVQELKVNLGDHVQAGQMLAYVADHRRLYIEGRALKQEAKLLARAAKEGWPVEAEFYDTPDEQLGQLAIEFLGATMDASGLTLPVYVPFENPMYEYTVKNKTHRAGQYRPGQKVLLKVAVAKVPDVFVLPIAAVAREGPEAYVFRQNGDMFDRKPVHILYEDYDEVVIANDGNIIPGIHYVAQNGAAALNRVLKANQAEGGGAAPHDH